MRTTHFFSLGFISSSLLWLWLCDDYGVSWDERVNRRFGHETLDQAMVKLGIGAGRAPEAEARNSSVVAE